MDTLLLVGISFFSLHGRNSNNQKTKGPTGTPLSSPIKKSEVKKKERLNPVGFFRFLQVKTKTNGNAYGEVYFEKQEKRQLALSASMKMPEY